MMSRYENKMSQITGPNFKRPEPLSEAELQAFEQHIGFSLPSDYREFLRDYGNTRLIVISAQIHLPESDFGDNVWASLDSFNGVERVHDQFFSFQESITFVDTAKSLELLNIGAGVDCDLMLVLTGEYEGQIYSLHASGQFRYYEVKPDAPTFDNLMERLEPLNP